MFTVNRNRLQQVERRANQAVDARHYAGIAWQIEQAGEVLSAGLAGHADHAQQRALQADDVYRIYSMTKPMVSVAILQQVEAGRIRLHDAVAMYLPRFARSKVMTNGGRHVAVQRAITIEDLLTHRSGITYDFQPECAVADQYREAGLAADGHRSLEALNEELASLPLMAQPGTTWTYGYSTDVLAGVLQVVCGQPLSDVLDAQLLKPLDMRNTAFNALGDRQQRLMPMHGSRDLDKPATRAFPPHRLEPLDVEQSYPSQLTNGYLRGGVGLFSTLSDYASFTRMLLDGKSAEGEVLLSGPMLQMLRCNRIPAVQLPLMIGYNAMPGYGWGLTGRVMLDVGQANTLTVDGEFGWAGAASTFFWVDPVNQVTGVVLSQFLGSQYALGQSLQTAFYQCLES